MTAIEIIEEIKRLPTAEQSKVLEFARQVVENRMLSPEELGVLAAQLAETSDPTEARRIEGKLIRGFYGSNQDA